MLHCADEKEDGADAGKKKKFLHDETMWTPNLMSLDAGTSSSEKEALRGSSAAAFMKRERRSERKER